MAHYVGYLIGVIIRGLIWGVAAKAVISNKGYYDEGTKWFWLGFFFGLIAVIVADTKPVYHRDLDVSYESWKKEQDQKLLQNDGWKCTCGRINASYVYSCACGKSKSDVAKALKPQSDMEKDTRERKEVVNTVKTDTRTDVETDVKDNIAAIREYKSLLDEGIITPEEFDVKKKQLLDL